MRLRPPPRYADQFFDLSEDKLLVPPGLSSQKLLSFWKTASAEDRRDLLHLARDSSLLTAFAMYKKVGSASLSTPSDDEIQDRTEVPYDEDFEDEDDDDDDMIYTVNHASDPDEYEEDYA